MLIIGLYLIFYIEIKELKSNKQHIIIHGMIIPKYHMLEHLILEKLIVIMRITLMKTNLNVKMTFIFSV